MTHETYKAAKARLLVELAALGWKIVEGLKVPHATSPDERLRLWFYPHALHYTLDYHKDRKSVV